MHIVAENSHAWTGCKFSICPPPPLELQCVRRAAPELQTTRFMLERGVPSLKVHVLKDCLCDPCGCPIHKFAEEAVTIDGEDFQRLRVLRGTSPLEGFHAHQKQWLGTFARHAEEAGQALLNDGAARWNRKRRSEGGRCNYLFAGDLMDSVDELSQDAPSELAAQITAAAEGIYVARVRKRSILEEALRAHSG